MRFILLSCRQEGVTVRNYQCWARWTCLGVNLKIWRELLWNVLSFYFPLAKHCHHRQTIFGIFHEWTPNTWMGWIFLSSSVSYLYTYPPPPQKRVLIFHFVLRCSLWLNVVLFLTESMFYFTSDVNAFRSIHPLIYFLYTCYIHTWVTGVGKLWGTPCMVCQSDCNPNFTCSALQCWFSGMLFRLLL